VPPPRLLLDPELPLRIEPEVVLIFGLVLVVLILDESLLLVFILDEEFLSVVILLLFEDFDTGVCL
jgi:uncharacterized membrane protein